MKGGRLVVGLDDLESGRAILERQGFSTSTEGARLVIAGAVEDPARVTKVLADQGLFLTELRREEANLETVFLELTADKDQP